MDIKDEWMQDLEANGRRINLVERKKSADRVPLYLSIGGYWGAEFAGFENDTYFLDREAQLQTQLKVKERFYGLTGIFIDNGVVTEASALGGEINYDKESVPWVKPILQDYDDMKKLKKFDPEKGILKSMGDQYRWLKSKGYDPGFYPGIGPMDTAALLRGANNFFMDMHTDHKWVDELMEISTETMIKVFKMEEELAGGMIPGGRLVIGDDYPGMVGPQHFKRFVYPWLEKIYSSFDSSYIKWWHSDSDQSEDIVKYLVELGVDVFFGMSPKVDVRRIRKDFGLDIAICGNVTPMNLRYSTPEKVEEECLELMKDMEAQKGAYILCAGGEIIKGTPQENIDAMIFSTFKL